MMTVALLYNLLLVLGSALSFFSVVKMNGFLGKSFGSILCILFLAADSYYIFHCAAYDLIALEEAVVFGPLIGGLVAGLGCRFLNKSSAQLITTVLVINSAVISWALLCIYYTDVSHPHVIDLFPWMVIGTFDISWSIKIDMLTMIMFVVVNTVSALVHVYSFGYMSHDPYNQRFFAYLSLFTFFMLLLVTSNNFMQLFCGWEGVGLCSYLLIGFWFKKDSANKASMKAFIVNRVGDIGLALGVFSIYMLFGSVSFDVVFAKVGDFANSQFPLFGLNYIEVICFLLFVGCMGKSAQLGLHTWLPDAMEGPTPVSALIHAATMVTAGVFLLARCSYLFEYAPITREIIVVVGAFTCLFAATVAIVQDDIKKIIAYSTCSQLGYMFMACGVSSYSAAIFHLMTHAFFKALLFLSAGSVIHAMSDEQNIKNMGGLSKKIVFTYVMFFVGSLALGGVFPFAGFYSKDVIIESLYVSGFNIAYIFSMLVAFLTAFYSWRLLILVFNGKGRYDNKVASHIHESPISMTFSLFILSLGSMFSGYLAYKCGITEFSGEFWGNSIYVKDDNNLLDMIHGVNWLVKYGPLIAGIIGISFAYFLYFRMNDFVNYLKNKLSYVHKFLINKWFFDELYDLIFVRPIKFIGCIFSNFVDRIIIDGLGPMGVAKIVSIFSVKSVKPQTGYVYHYALFIIIGLLITIMLALYMKLKG